MPFCLSLLKWPGIFPRLIHSNSQNCTFYCYLAGFICCEMSYCFATKLGYTFGFDGPEVWNELLSIISLSVITFSIALFHCGNRPPQLGYNPEKLERS